MREGEDEEIEQELGSRIRKYVRLYREVREDSNGFRRCGVQLILILKVAKSDI